MNDLPPEFPNVALAQALRDSSADRIADLLLRGLVLVPVMTDDGGPRLVTIESGNGALAVQAFTSIEAFTQARGRSYAIVAGRYVTEAGRSLGAVAVLVDPGTMNAVSLSLEFLSHRESNVGIPLRGGQVAVGAPAEAPAPVLVKAVRTAVRSTKGVNAGYLFQMAGDGGVARLVAGFCLAEGIDPRATMPQAVHALSDELPAGLGIDALHLHGDLLDGVRASVTSIR